jgi:hypothetical protein
MRALAAADMLSGWERGRTRSLHDRILDVLGAANPEMPAEEIAALPIGERDQALLAFREQAFGPTITCVTTCPGCGRDSEFTLEIARLRAPRRAGPDQPLSLSRDGYEVEFRLPNGGDLVAIARSRDADEARARLLERCVLAVSNSGAAVATVELPRSTIDAMEDAMASADPGAEFRVSLACPVCARSWEAPFDIASVLWTELDAWARRLLLDVHVLASAYGWREADILGMSPVRRQAYLELVGS